MRVEIHIPIRVHAIGNLREHHHARRRRVAKERQATAIACLAAGLRADGKLLPCVVTFTRIAPRKLDEGGGGSLDGSMKAVRDEIAVRLGLPIRKLSDGQGMPVADDTDQRVTWAQVKQERGKAREYGVRVAIETRET